MASSEPSSRSATEPCESLNKSEPALIQYRLYKRRFSGLFGFVRPSRFFLPFYSFHHRSSSASSVVCHGRGSVRLRQKVSLHLAHRLPDIDCFSCHRVRNYSGPSQLARQRHKLCLHPRFPSCPYFLLSLWRGSLCMSYPPDQPFPSSPP